jgi:hypothetical protein
VFDPNFAWRITEYLDADDGNRLRLIGVWDAGVPALSVFVCSVSAMSARIVEVAAKCLTLGWLGQCANCDMRLHTRPESVLA